MIVVDGKELNLSVPITDKERFEKLSDNEKWVIEKFQEIKSRKRIRIIDRKNLDKMQLAFKPKMGIDLAGKRRNPETGADEYWVFCDKANITKLGQKIYPKKHLSHFWHSGIEFTSIDIIFFLLYIVNVEKYGLVIENKEEEAKAKIGAQKNEAKVKDWIYDQLLDNEVEPICLRYGINTEEKTIPELRVELFELISNNDKKQGKVGGFKTFIDEMNSQSEVVKIGSYFNSALQKKQISYNPTKRTFFWAESGDVIGGIIPPARVSTKEEYTIQYLLQNKEDRDFFLASVVDDKLIEKNEDYTLMTHVKKLQSYAKNKFGETFPNSYTLDQGKEWVRQKLEESTKETE